jgi:hypothetical protein
MGHLKLVPKNEVEAHTLIPQSVNNTLFTEKFSVRKECQSGFQHNRHWGVIWYIDWCWANQGTAVMVQGLGKRIFQAELQAINCCNCNCLFASY